MAAALETAKRRVLRKYPGAIAIAWGERGELWTIQPSDNEFGLNAGELGEGNTAAAAWVSAAKRLRAPIDRAKP